MNRNVFLLNNGQSMPQIGLGVLFAKNNHEVENAVSHALTNGYRKIDTASAYNNEEGVGRGLRKSGIAREAVFITTKVWNTEQGYDSTLKAFDNSLNRLQTDYIDMYLIHWPVRKKYHETYTAMEHLLEKGKVGAIGTCNFSVAQLTDLMATSNIPPALNQVEMHPYLGQRELVRFCQEKHIQLEAWRPLMMGKVLAVPELREIGASHGKTAAQAALKWLLQKGVSAIPKSVTPSRIQENFALFDFELSHSEMQIIDGLNKNKRFGEDLSHIH